MDQRETETWLCKTITSAFRSNYYCYTFKDLNRAFLNGRGYQQTIEDAMNVDNDTYSNKLLHCLVDLIKGPIVYSETILRGIRYACASLGIPLMHLLYFCDKCFEHTETIHCSGRNIRALGFQPKHSFLTKYFIKLLRLYRYLTHRSPITLVAGRFVRELYNYMKNNNNGSETTCQAAKIYVPYDLSLSLIILNDLSKTFKVICNDFHLYRLIEIYCKHNFENFEHCDLFATIYMIKDNEVQECSNDKHKVGRLIINKHIENINDKFCITDIFNKDIDDDTVIDNFSINVIRWKEDVLHPNVSMFAKLACRPSMFINDKPVKEDKERVNYFNSLKRIYQKNFKISSLHSALFLVSHKREKIGNFVCKSNYVHINDYNERKEMIDNILQAPCLLEYKQSINLERSLIAYNKGVVTCNNRTKLGNFLAIYNAFIIRHDTGTENNSKTIHFEYDLMRTTFKQKTCQQNLYLPYESSGYILGKLTRSWSTASGLDVKKDSSFVVKTGKEEYTQMCYNEKIKSRLSINYDMDSRHEKVLAVFTGIVVHATLNVTGPICKAKIINKPLVRFINKHKTMTCSYYKELLQTGFPQEVKVNFNFQGTDFFIRSKVLSIYDKLFDVMVDAGKSVYITVSNQCAHIRSLHYGIMDSFSYRNKMLKNKLNCFKIPSFPGLRLVDENQTLERPRDNIIHRETVLTRVHKTHDMIENIRKLKEEIYPFTERDEVLHELAYEVESNLKLVLNGTLLGILKMFYLYYRNFNDNEFNDNKNSIIHLFTNTLWINQYMIAQNGSLCRTPMCHEIKETTAIENTSIKTAKIKKKRQNITGNYGNNFCYDNGGRRVQKEEANEEQEPFPPVVYDPELYTELSCIFKDMAIGILTPKLWKKKGAFNYLAVLTQAPTRIVYGEVGQKMIRNLYTLLNERGGRKSFPDCYRLLDVYKRKLQLLDA